MNVRVSLALNSATNNTNARLNSGHERKSMKKIQFDTINGVYEVESFDDDSTWVDRLSLDDLKNAEDGVYASAVDDDFFEKIKCEYGITEIIKNVKG